MFLLDMEIIIFVILSSIWSVGSFIIFGLVVDSGSYDLVVFVRVF